MRPGFTDRDAVLNSSDCFVEYAVYRFCIQEIPIIKKAKKKPMPTTTPKHVSTTRIRGWLDLTITGTDRQNG
jgi:hypothetical protein